MSVISGMITGYEKVGILVVQGAIPDFNQLGDDCGRTNLAMDMNMNPKTLRRRLDDPGEWSVRELGRLADLLRIDHAVLLKMADEAIAPKRKARK